MKKLLIIYLITFVNTSYAIGRELLQSLVVKDSLLELRINDDAMDSLIDQMTEPVTSYRIGENRGQQRALSFTGKVNPLLKCSTIKSFNRSCTFNQNIEVDFLDLIQSRKLAFNLNKPLNAHYSLEVNNNGDIGHLDIECNGRSCTLEIDSGFPVAFHEKYDTSTRIIYKNGSVLSDENRYAGRLAMELDSSKVDMLFSVIKKDFSLSQGTKRVRFSDSSEAKDNCIGEYFAVGFKTGLANCFKNGQLTIVSANTFKVSYELRKEESEFIFNTVPLEKHHVFDDNVTIFGIKARVNNTVDLKISVDRQQRRFFIERTYYL